MADTNTQIYMANKTLNAMPRHMRTRYNNNTESVVVACLCGTYHFTSLRLSMGLFIF